jgi:hypothetical protein
LRILSLAAFGLIITLSACTDRVCTLLPAPTIQIAIQDSMSGAPAAYQSSLIAQASGSYDSTSFGPPRADSLTLRYVQTASLTQSGDYTVRIRRAGYQLWQQSGVRVDVSSCGSGPSVSLIARLQRAP